MSSPVADKPTVAPGLVPEGLGLAPSIRHLWLRGASGQRMHALAAGHSGPRVLLLHGNPSWSYMWRQPLADLAGEAQLVALDHVGMGLSDKPSDSEYRYTLASRVADVQACIEQLGWQGQPVALVCHDWGGMIGTAWAVQQQVPLTALAALNTGAFPLPGGKPLPGLLRLGRDSALGEWLIRGLNAFARGSLVVGLKRRKLAPEVAAAFLAPYGSWADRIATVRFVQDIPLGPGDAAWDLVQRTAEGLSAYAEVPTFLGFGLRDFVFDRHFLAEWQRRFPQAEVLALPEASHMVLEDAPEQMPQALAAFLRRALGLGVGA